jgi:hypothetical protein
VSFVAILVLLIEGRAFATKNKKGTEKKFRKKSFELFVPL